MPTLTAVAKSLESLRPELARLLLPIQNEQDYRFALEVVREFWDSKEDAVQAFLSVLTERIQTYEETHYPVEQASAGEVLEFLMEQRGLKQEEVAQAIGVHQTTLSRILREQRKPTREQVKRLAEFFKVSPVVFLT